jgi:hypothetical protein
MYNIVHIGFAMRLRSNDGSAGLLCRSVPIDT